MALGFARRVAQLLSLSWLWLSHGRHPLGMITLAIATNRGGGLCSFSKTVSYIYIYIYIYIHIYTYIYIYINTYIYIYAATFIHIHTSCKFPVSMPVFPSAAAPKSGWHARILSPDNTFEKKKTMQYCIAIYYIAISCSPKETQCSHIIYHFGKFQAI